MTDIQISQTYLKKYIQIWRTYFMTVCSKSMSTRSFTIFPFFSTFNWKCHYIQKSHFNLVILVYCSRVWIAMNVLIPTISILVKHIHAFVWDNSCTTCDFILSHIRIFESVRFTAKFQWTIFLQRVCQAWEEDLKVILAIKTFKIISAKCQLIVTVIMVKQTSSNNPKPY